MLVISATWEIRRSKVSLGKKETPSTQNRLVMGYRSVVQLVACHR
jgi:hypothetical protein